MFFKQTSLRGAKRGVRIKVTHNKFSDYKCMNFLTNFQTLKENFSNKQV